MKNVTRTEPPKILLRNASRWKKNLLSANNGRNKKKINNAKNKYKKKEVKNALIKMYAGLCCYCEGNIRAVSFGDIEHLKPIAKYPENGFDWNNLHLACGRCNNTKSDQYDTDHPILDPTDPEPIDNHLSYRLSAEKSGLSIRSKTNRGSITKKHTDLNRQDLCEARGEIYNRTLDIAESLDANPNAPINEEMRKELELLKNGRYGSVVEMILRNYN